MITIKEAEATARQYLTDLQGIIGNPIQITKIQKESFGWVFFYQSKDHLKTGNISSMLAGNAPFIVCRETGAVEVLGTAYPADVYRKEYAQLQS